MNNGVKKTISQEEINEVGKIFESCREYAEKGNVADYIPELAKADKKLYGAYIVQEGGDDFMFGDYDVKFTMQSVSKVVTLTRALLDIGFDEILKKVTFEPTDYGFNSIVNLELKNGNRPLNPLINAGAIVCTSLIKGDAAKRVCELVRLLADNPNIDFDEDTYKSENETGSIITPAEKPSEPAKKAVFVFLVKKAIALPIPVESPAKRVSKKAIKTVSNSIESPLFSIKFCF